MTCYFSEKVIEDVIAFHGHSCPGLAIGIRVAELAMRKFGDQDSTEMVTVSETDMCGVDAIQFLTDCTYGKGNFIHRDYGKMAFSFFDRLSEKGFRVLLKPDARGAVGVQLDTLTELTGSESEAAATQQKITQLRQQLQERFMSLPLEEMFDVTQLDSGIPRPAAILQTLVCECCGEAMMESRSRRFNGKVLCIPCFATVEQKI